MGSELGWEKEGEMEGGTQTQTKYSALEVRLREKLNKENNLNNKCQIKQGEKSNPFHPPSNSNRDFYQDVYTIFDRIKLTIWTIYAFRVLNSHQ